MTAAKTGAALTRVTLLFLHTRVNVWMRFGEPVQETVCNRSRRILSFAPGSVFCRVHWEANAYGTTLWRLAVLQAGEAQQTLQRVVGVQPGALLLLEVSGANKVQRMLSLIDGIEALGIPPTSVSIAYWRTAHNRFAANLRIPPYTAARHAAALMRQETAR